MKSLSTHINEGILANNGLGVLASIHKFCQDMGIRHYTLVDGKINVDGDVNL